MKAVDHQHGTGTHPLEEGEKLFHRLAPAGATPPWESLRELAPALGAQVQHGLGAVMSRPALDLRTRELAVVCMLAALGGCEPQLAFHVGGALQAGATAQEVIEALTQVSLYAGLPRALNAVGVAQQVFAEREVAVEEGPRAVVAAFLSAFRSGDLAAARGFLAEDVTWSLPGERDRAPWAGHWAGPQAVTACLTLIAQHLGASAITVRELLPAGERVYVPVTIEHPDGLPAAVLEFQVRHGRIIRCQGYAADGG